MQFSRFRPVAALILPIAAFLLLLALLLVALVPAATAQGSYPPNISLTETERVIQTETESEPPETERTPTETETEITRVLSNTGSDALSLLVAALGLGAVGWALVTLGRRRTS